MALHWMLLLATSPMIHKFHLNLNRIPANSTYPAAQERQKGPAIGSRAVSSCYLVTPRLLLQFRILIFSNFKHHPDPADNNCHHVALTGDGLNKTLNVDGVEAAQDTHLAFLSSEDGLYLGTGSAMQPGTFFSGLIDDVRIYNRAVAP